MSNFDIEHCEIEGIRIITPKVYGDERGYFFESFQDKEFSSQGISENFVQDNQSGSQQGVLRGLHFQKNHPQDKLVRVLHGEIFDVAVDLRKGSSHFGKWFGIYLSEENKKQLYIPKGFAHGFLVTSPYAEVLYKCSEFYHPEDEAGIIWNDSAIGIKWPIKIKETPILSKKDQEWQTLKDYLNTNKI